MHKQLKYDVLNLDWSHAQDKYYILVCTLSSNINIVYIILYLMTCPDKIF